jgi:hypothetical protein
VEGLAMKLRNYKCWSEDAGEDEADAGEFEAREASEAALACFKRDSADEFFERGDVHVRDVETGELRVFAISASMHVSYHVTTKKSGA